MGLFITYFIWRILRKNNKNKCICITVDAISYILYILWIIEKYQHLPILPDTVNWKCKPQRAVRCNDGVRAAEQANMPTQAGARATVVRSERSCGNLYKIRTHAVRSPPPPFVVDRARPFALRFDRARLICERLINMGVVERCRCGGAENEIENTHTGVGKL